MGLTAPAIAAKQQAAPADETSFRIFVCMDLLAFEELLSRVEFVLTKNHTAYIRCLERLQ